MKINDIIVEDAQSDQYVKQFQKKKIDRELKQLSSKLKGALQSVSVQFAGHFADRMIDSRNDPMISLDELETFMKKIDSSDEIQDKLAQAGEKGLQAVVHEIKSKLNIPFMIRLMPDGPDANDIPDLKLVPKTIMRKDDFGTSNPKFTMEGIDITEERLDEVLPLLVGMGARAAASALARSALARSAGQTIKTVAGRVLGRNPASKASKQQKSKKSDTASKQQKSNKSDTVSNIPVPSADAQQDIDWARRGISMANEHINRMSEEELLQLANMVSDEELNEALPAVLGGTAARKFGADLLKYLAIDQAVDAVDGDDDEEEPDYARRAIKLSRDMPA